MLNFYKINNIKMEHLNKVKNLLSSNEIGKYKEKFQELFGEFRIMDFNGSKYYENEVGIIFCPYSVSLALLQNFGTRSEIVLKDQLWKIKLNGSWYLLSEYFGFLPEDTLNKAKELLPLVRKLYLRWPFEREKDHIVITNGKFALMVPPADIKIA